MNAFLQALNAMTCNETVVLQLSDEIFVDLKSESIKGLIEAEKADFYCGVTLEENPQKIKKKCNLPKSTRRKLTKRPFFLHI